MVDGEERDGVQAGEKEYERRCMVTWYLIDGLVLQKSRRGSGELPIEGRHTRPNAAQRS